MARSGCQAFVTAKAPIKDGMETPNFRSFAVLERARAEPAAGTNWKVQAFFKKVNELASRK
jgi:hypothetical protein